MAEILHHEKGWSRPRRLIVVRHEIREKKRAGGKKLIEIPGHLFQALVTNLGDGRAPLAVWRDYNGRAGCECVIKELDGDFALPKLILSKFWATEAALALAVISYNLVVLFQQKLGWQHERITAKTMRYWIFVTAGCLTSHARNRVLQLAIPPGQRDWWRRVWEKIACPWPNCHAVGHAAPPSGI